MALPVACKALRKMAGGAIGAKTSKLLRRETALWQNPEVKRKGANNSA